MKLVNIHKQLFWLLLLPLAAQAQEWTLQQCLDTAQVHNRALRIASTNEAIGAEKHREAVAQLLPRLAVNADYKYYADLPTQLLPLSVFNGPAGQFKEAQFGVPHTLNASVQLAMPLYNPQVMGAIRTTDAAQALTALQFRKTEEQVLTEVCNLYYSAQILQAQRVFVDSNLTSTQQLLGNMQVLQQQLMARGTDVNRVQLQLSQLQLQQTTIAGKYDQVLNALKVTMGIAPETPVRVGAEIRYEAPVAYSEADPVDLQLVEIQRVVAETELRTLRQSRLPSVGLAASYGTMGFGYDEQPNEFLKFFPLSFAGVQVSYPLFNGTVTQHKINQKKLELTNNEWQQSMAADQHQLQLANATTQRSVALQTIALSKAQIAQADQICQQVRVQQQQGVATLAEVLQADATLREVQQSHLAAVVEYLKADVELKRISGNFSH